MKAVLRKCWYDNITSDYAPFVNILAILVILGVSFLSGTAFMAVLLLAVTLPCLPGVYFQASSSDAEDRFRTMMLAWPMTGKQLVQNHLKAADMLAAAVYVMPGIPVMLILGFVTEAAAPLAALELWLCGLCAALAWSALHVILRFALPSGRSASVINWIQGMVYVLYLGWHLFSALGGTETEIVLPTLPVAAAAAVLQLICVPVSLTGMKRRG